MPDHPRQLAAKLIREHGRAALGQAVDRIINARATSDRDGADRWEQVMAEIEELQRTERREGEALQ